MKTFPKSFSLNIFGKKVKVKTVKDLGDNDGLFSPRDWAILISEKQTKEEAVKTLLHEAAHAMIHRTGINQSLGHDLEEVICENISTVIFENFNLSLKKN